MIAIIDYGVGNLFSLTSSLGSIGAETVITSDPDVIRKADKLLLPGVGAFSDAIAKLRASGLDKVIIEEGRGGKVEGRCGAYGRSHSRRIKDPTYWLECFARMQRKQAFPLCKRRRFRLFCSFLLCNRL